MKGEREKKSNFNYFIGIESTFLLHCPLNYVLNECMCHTAHLVLTVLSFFLYLVPSSSLFLSQVLTFNSTSFILRLSFSSCYCTSRLSLCLYWLLTVVSSRVLCHCLSLSLPVSPALQLQDYKTSDSPGRSGMLSPHTRCCSVWFTTNNGKKNRSIASVEKTFIISRYSLRPVISRNFTLFTWLFSLRWYCCTSHHSTTVSISVFSVVSQSLFTVNFDSS